MTLNRCPIGLWVLALVGLYACESPPGDPTFGDTAGPGSGVALASGDACASDEACPDAEVCDPDLGECVQCFDDAHCPFGVCEPEMRGCLQCLDDTHCPDGVCHPSTAVCVQCFDDAHCPDGVCEPESHTCVECTSNAHCASGFCNAQTGGCVGCGLDKDCDDGETCTKDACAQGSCVYEPTADGVACDDGDACTDGETCADGACVGGALADGCECEALSCDAGEPVDSDGDGCDDACACPQHVCEAGEPVDSDGDGCDDACACPQHVCEAGEPVDSDGDGCDDDCACDALECIAGAPIDTDGDGCDDDCLCEPLTCDVGEPVDSDGDGCDDECACPSITCEVGEPVDADEDGCADTCVCPDLSCEVGAPLDTDGDGCPDLCAAPVCQPSSGIPCPTGYGCVLPPGACGSDPIGECELVAEACPDVWEPVCGCDGQTYDSACVLLLAGGQPDFEGTCEPICVPLVCSGELLPSDTSGDGCPDSCACPTTGEPPAADGTCPCEEAPCACTPTEIAVDGDQDGCPDSCLPCDPLHTASDLDGDQCGDVCVPCESLLCSPGASAVDTDSDGCPDTCQCALEIACAGDTYPADTDADGCDDACLCPSGGEPEADGSCGCAVVLLCAPGSHPVDTDGDGCGDACVTECQTACDCYQAGLEFAAPCDALCPTCGNAWACEDSECVATCGPIASEVAACVECPEPPVCGPGQTTIDADEDGCPDACLCAETGEAPDPELGCAPCGGFVCDEPLPPFAVLIDEDGDGCYDVTDACPVGSQGADTSGDGCPDLCATCDGPKPTCSGAAAAADTDADNCLDTCVCLDGPGLDPTLGCAPEKCSSHAECHLAGGDYMCVKATGGCDDTGVCKPKPAGCADVWEPVCGCDGTTYGNACDALASGVVVASTGACEGFTCDGDLDCGEGLHCAVPTGACGSSVGVCQSKPAECGALEPVCGCDGETYDTDCEAVAAGVVVEHPGACASETECVHNDNCNPTHYCATPPGDCGGIGVCAWKPEVCTDEVLEVCGCDGSWWSNPCEAAMVGVGIDDDAGCEPPVCASDVECGLGWYCAVPLGHCGEVGQCVQLPEACDEIFDPVCGCDGETWSNACEAVSNGVTPASQGECEVVCVPITCPLGGEAVDTDGDDCPDLCQTPACAALDCAASDGEGADLDGDGCPDVCGMACKQDDECAPDQWCEKAAGYCGGAGGVCAPISEACDGVFEPVCGCDGETYASPCVASASLAAVAYAGDCGPVCTAIACEPGSEPWDKDGDGCADGCLKPCEAAADCPDTLFCRRAGGECAGLGVCDAKPEVCSGLYEPVCGCDGQLYSNTCEAAAAGVNPAGSSDCSPTCDDTLACPDGETKLDADGDGCPDGCVVPCEASQDCKDLEYCARAGGDCEGLGYCAELPGDCLTAGELVAATVCGCDGASYDSACVAAKSSVNVASDGVCPVVVCESKPCPAGSEAVDSTGDACPDTCVAPCASACDCYEADISFAAPCEKDCATCDNHWACEEGLCVGICGPVPDDTTLCGEVKPIEP